MTDLDERTVILDALDREISAAEQQGRGPYTMGQIHALERAQEIVSAGWQARAVYDQARVAQLVTALEWYADPDHWACPWDYTHADACAYYCQATEDRGETAREVLAQPEPSAATSKPPDHLWSMSLPPTMSTYQRCCDRPQSDHAGVAWEMYQRSGSPDDEE